MRSLWYNKAKESDRMKKILAALAVLAVIAAGTATALFQQLQPEEYESVDAAVAENKQEAASIYQTIDIGDDVIVILYHEANDAYSTMYLKKSEDGYVLKEKNGPIRNELGFTHSFQYSKKETAVITLTPDETGKMVASLKIETK